MLSRTQKFGKTEFRTIPNLTFFQIRTLKFEPTYSNLPKSLKFEHSSAKNGPNFEHDASKTRTSNPLQTSKKPELRTFEMYSLQH